MKPKKDKQENIPQQKEIQSLAGKIDKNSMGTRDQKQKPKKPTTTAPTHRQQTPPTISFKPSNLLTQKFDQTLLYRPKTQQNKHRYQNFLGRLNKIVHDLPQQTLISVADQILAILKSSDTTEIERKVQAEAILGEKVGQEEFLDLVGVVKGITDYRVGEDGGEGEGDGLEIVIDQEEGEDGDGEGDGGIVEEIDSGEQGREQVVATRKTDKQTKKQSQQEKPTSTHTLTPNDIDAHWLHSKLTTYFQPSQAQKIHPEILSALSSPTKLECENNLLALLNYDQYDLIKLLLQNRELIYYCTRYHHSQSQREREGLLEEMRGRGIHLVGRKGVGGGKGRVDLVKRKSGKKDVGESNMDVQGEQEQILVIPELAKDEQIHKINKRIIDLTLHDSTEQAPSKQQHKFKLPPGSTKTANPGYQQIHIPPTQTPHTASLTPIDQLPAWMHPVFDGIKKLNAIQSRVCAHTLHTNRNMLVCAPTSAGKTNIALMAILRVVDQYRGKDGSIDVGKWKVVYVAPMKALVAEITGNLGHRLGGLGINVRELTGDMHLTKGQIQQTQVIVSTPQKWDIITRKAGDRIFTEQVRLLIIDQIHLLSDARGPVLESLIARTIKQSQNAEQHVRIVGLSATLPNYRDVGAVLRVTPKDGLFYFDQSYRPVPLEQLYCGISEKKGARKMMMTNQILYEKVMERVGNNQMIIFVHSRRDTFKTASYIKQTAFVKNQSHKILKPQSQSKRILQRIIAQSTQQKQKQRQKMGKIDSQDLKKVLGDGIGIHHAGLSRGDRDLVQQLFADRHLNILVSTATLAWGVNLPAHTVIIKGTQVYSPEQGRWIELSLQDVMQMLGRAGRPRYDERGEGIIISGYDEIRYYLSLLNQQVPLQSQMMKMLPDQLNAEIVLGSVNNIRDGVNWLSYTYLYVRMLKNPKYYSIPPQQLQQDPYLLKRRVNLIHTAATILQKNGLINYDRRSQSFNSTFLGKIASYYYIKYASMAIYNTNLKPNLGLIEIFKIFSMSLEFKHITVREEEKIELQKLMESVPVPIKGSIEDPTSKISVLLQAHISKLQLQGYALNVDKVYVTQSASRIIRALFQICTKRGWGQVALKCLQIAKMIDRSMWSCMNPLRQFHEIPEYVLSKLQKKQQFSWQSFYQMTPQQIGDLTKFGALGKIIHKFVHQVPRVQINAYAQPITRSCLRVQLTIKSDFKWQTAYHGKQQPFWLFILDCNEESLLFTYPFTLTPTTATFPLTITIPLFEIPHPLYFIRVVSDRWVCPDSTLPLSFRSMILPSKFPAPNQVLDLQPLPGGNLIAPALARELRIGYLNQIQTQVYGAVVQGTGNCFLGACQGSGKFTLTLFTIHKTLTQSKKSILILPPRTPLTPKTLHLQKLFPKHKTTQTTNDLAKDSILLHQSDILVTNPSAWDVLTRRWKVRKGFDRVGLIVVLGLEGLGGEGGDAVEVVVSRMRAVQGEIGDGRDGRGFRIVGIGGSLADYVDVGEWIGAPPENVFNFHPNIRQNSVQIIFSTYDQPLRESRFHLMQKTLLTTLKHFPRPTLIFTPSKKQSKLTSLDLVSLLSVDPNPKRLRKVPDQQMKIFAKNISDQYLTHILEYGIGYVYEGMNQVEREIVLKLFDIEGIGVLVVEGGMMGGIRGVRAFVVGVLDCEYYDGRRERWVDYTIPEMMQMMSYANISQKDKTKSKQYSTSKFLLMCHTPKKPHYKKFLFEPYPLESTLHQPTTLANHLNTAITTKTIQSKQDCIDWLTWTFLYRRLVRNPNYYNLEEVSQEGISGYLSELVQGAVGYLEGVRCVEVEGSGQGEGEGQGEGTGLEATNLGIVGAYYGVRVETVGGFVAGISENMKLRYILELISEAEQLKQYSYQPGQSHTFAQILTQLHQPPTTKPQSLLLAHLHRLPIPPQHHHQLQTLLPLTHRLCQSLIDIVSSFSYLKPLILCMQFCQMLVQAMWVGDSKLLQVVDRGLAGVLEREFGVRDVGEFIGMEDQVRMGVLKGKDVTGIASACNRYPIVGMECVVEGVDGDQVQLTVTLSRDDELQHQYVICPYYPVQNKQQYWWVIVGDKKTNKVLATKRSVLKNSAKLQLSFELIQGLSRYSVYALCDSYVGCDQMEEIEVEGDRNGNGDGE